MRVPPNSLEETAQKADFRRRLLEWYDANKRDLPWRKDPDPYRVWLSEIMLQQTRVAAVVEHYHRFLKRFPSVEKLAAARGASVLAAWSGLGYYRRARMVHAAAREVVKEHGGRFPETVEGLRALPGIGRYTAAAIASIAFDCPAAVVDGNVERVLQRLSGNGHSKEGLWEEAERLLDRKRLGDFNQAMMELGATICVPRQPACLVCPVRAFCRTKGELAKIQGKPRQKKQEIFYALCRRNGSVFLVQRPRDASLMPGMWELPECPSQDHSHQSYLTLRHSITVTDYTVRVMEGRPGRKVPGKWVARERLTTVPLTGLARKVLRAAKII